MKNLGSTSKFNPFGFVMYMPVSAGAFSYSCLTFATIGYETVSGLTGFSYSTSSDVYYKEIDDLSDWFDKSNGNSYTSTSDVTSAPSALTDANNRILCTPSPRYVATLKYDLEVAAAGSPITVTKDIGLASSQPD
jgi:hypothetical protein